MSESVRPYGQQPTRLLSTGFSRQEYWSGLPFPSPFINSRNTLLNPLLSQPSLPSPPLKTVYSSAFSEMSYKQIHLTYSLLNITYFTYQNALRFIYVVAVINSYFFFLLIQVCIDIPQSVSPRKFGLCPVFGN